LFRREAIDEKAKARVAAIIICAPERLDFGVVVAMTNVPIC